MEYRVIAAGDFAEMAVKVNAALAENWQIQGGIAAYTVVERDGYGNTYHIIWFMQALVKETP